MSTPSSSVRQRTPSTATPATLSKLEPKDATDALWNLNLLAALRAGDPSKLQPYLSELSRQATVTRRASTSPSLTGVSANAGLAGGGKSASGGPPTGGQNGSHAGSGRRVSGEQGKENSVLPHSAAERGAYILHTAIRVASCSTIALLLSHRQISPNATYPLAPPSARTTPLHLAAHLGREDVVRLLLDQEGVDDTLRDGQGRSVLEVAANSKISKILQDSAQDLTARYHALAEEYMRSPPSAQPPQGLIELLKQPRSAQLDLTVLISGTTPLHTAASRAHLPLLDLLLQRGADIFARDSRGRQPLDVAGSGTREKDGVRAVLRQFANRDLSLVGEGSGETGSGAQGGGGKPPDLRGYLSKYANVAKGWSTRYFVLQDGLLSYYRNQSDYPFSSRGSIHTSQLSLKTSALDKLRLELILHPPSTSGLPGTERPGGGAGGVVRWYLKGEQVGEVGRWAAALRRNIDFYAASTGGRGVLARVGSVAGSSIAKEEPGGPLRRGYTRTLSISGLGKRKSGSGGESPARSTTGSTAGSRTGSTTLLTSITSAAGGVDVQRTQSGVSLAPSGGSGSVRDAPTPAGSGIAGVATELLAGSESSDAEVEGEGEEELDGAKEPPFPDWEMGAEGVRTQVDALRQAVKALALPPAAGQTLSEGLAALGSLASSWRGQQRAREKWYAQELERERQARKLWEESLAGVVGESERMERELLKAGRRLRSYRNLRASLVEAQTAGGSMLGEGEGVASPTAVEMEKELPEPPELEEGGMEVPATAEAAPTGPEAPVSTAGVPPAGTSATSGSSAFVLPKVATTTSTTDEEDDEDDEFFDAIDSGLLPLTLPSPLAKPAAQPEPSSQHPALLDPDLYAGYVHPRTRLPIDDDQRPPVSLWAVLKNSIGKDLTKISFPVFFNEPTSMLQRMAEDMEFSECLDAAVREADPLKRIAFVAAFAMSNYSSTIGRIAKPFNPMLGETFEYASFDKQYRYFSEQVSHHPPISACYCESPSFLYYGEVDAKNKFMGKSFEIRPTGAAFADLKLSPEMVEHPERYPVEEENGEKKLIEHYSWKKVITNVSGFLLGAPSIDHYGEMRVVNHRTGDTCILTFKPRGWRGTGREIKGAVYDARGQLEWEIAGRWGSQLVMRHADSMSELGPDVSVHGPTSPSSQTTPEYIVLWRNTEKPPAPFNLTPYAITLNDLPKDPNLLRKWLPITDCRLRPDQRAFEEGRYEEANGLKQDQEEFQRATRRARERGERPPHRPRWFTPDVDDDNGERVWRPTRRGGEVEYWVEREEAGLSGRPWKDVEKIFIDV